MPPVFATAYMVAFLEATCIELLAPHLDEGEHTVGIHVDVSHVAATPVGMNVKAQVELVEIAKRTLTFKVFAYDESGLIGEGLHKRAVIHVGMFMAAVNSKLDQQTSNLKERFPDEPV
ncbi:thioesterase family protein [uncultured Roseobacter sp.]|uniref:thioesterase family protein n=1 Tax=uncultured Roseobacter sp. TaxID=114847 RepID=UPI002619426D|nr:thioesterase family protein [uncultured Roseobacter sp.]